MSIFNNSTSTYGSLVCSELDITSDNNQIIIGSGQLTTIDIDTSTERTLTVPNSTAAAEFVLSVGGVISGTIEHAETADIANNALDSLHADTADTASTATLADNSLLLNGLINSTTGTSTNTIVQRGTYGQTNLGRTDITALGSNTNILNVKDTANYNMLNISSDDINLGSVGHPVQLFLNGSEILPSTTPPTPSLQDCLDKSLTDGDNPMLVSSKPFTIKGTHATQDILDVYTKEDMLALQILNSGRVRPVNGLNSSYSINWFLTFTLASEINNHIKLGYTAGSDNIANGSIVLGDIYTTSNSGFFVSQVRQVSDDSCGNILVFDNTTKEIRYISGLNIIEGVGISAQAISGNSIAVESDSNEIVKVTNSVGENVFKIDSSNDEIVIGESGNLIDVVVDTTFTIDHTLNQVRIGSASNNNDLLVNDVVVQINPDLQQIYDNNPASNLSVDDFLNISRSDNNDNALVFAIRNSTDNIASSFSASGDIFCGDITSDAISCTNLVSDTTTCKSLISDNLLVYKNVVINGDMVVHQRGNKNITPVSSGADINYTLDRWQVWTTNAGPCTFTISQENTPTTAGSPYFDRFRKYLKFSRTTTSNSSASHSIRLIQNIEGNDVWHYYLGTSSARPLILSFWFIAYTTGIYSVAVQNASSSSTYKSTFSVTGNTWSKRVVYISSGTTGTWLTNENEGLRIVFDLGNTRAGQYDTTSGTWTNDNSTFKTGCHNIGLSSSAIDYIGVTGVQIEEGEAYTGFEYIPYQVQLNRCQRYYEKFIYLNGEWIITGHRYTSNTVLYDYKVWKQYVEKRVIPTFEFSSASHFLAEKYEGTNSTANISSFTVKMSKREATSIQVTMSTSIGGTAGEVVMMRSKNDLCYIGFVAEL